MIKQRAVNFLLRAFPENKTLHKLNNQIRFRYHHGYYMPRELVNEAENDPKQQRALMAEYTEKWKDLAKETDREIEELTARAPQYRDRREDLTLKEDMRFCRFAYGFKPDEYLAYSLEQKSPEERKKYVSSRDLLCMIYQVNDRLDFSVFNDKAKTYERFGPYYMREAVSISREEDYGRFLNYIRKHPVFVKKNVFEAMGHGVELIDTANCGMSERELFDSLIAQGKCLLEERVTQSASYAALNPSSVNTIRFITYNTKHGVIVPYCFAKIGRNGSFIDNGAAGGILVGIDSETGKFNTDGFDEFITRYESHPDSGIRFSGYQLPDIPEGVELSKKLSAMTPSVKFIGWDFAHTDKGWVIIEGNGMSQLIGPQIVWERGVKSEMEQALSDMELLVK